jgi:HAD superfamily phosphatase (TIGR01668 family)
MPPILHPDLHLPAIEALDLTLLRERGIRGVLLDLDNTLTPWKSREMTPAVAAWVAALAVAGIGACVVSNAATARRVQSVADVLSLPWITRALKPLPYGFRRAMALLDTTPDTTAVIGDQLFTDILGGNRLGLFTILVDPISPREALFTRLVQRPLERMLGRKPVER